MLRAFSTAATGMTAQQMLVDVIANNLANINTTGFKRSQVNFEDLMYTKLNEPSEMEPSGFEVGNGVSPGSTVKVFTPGEMHNTGRDLDVAIQGDGFFKVTAVNGNIRYTRDGALRMNANGDLVTSAGHLFGITIGTDVVSISIATNGTISVFDGTNTTSPGQLRLSRFPNPSGLSSQGGNLFAETGASGSATEGDPGTSGYGGLQQHFLEKANVQMVTELVNLIMAQRAYEINSRAIKAGDEMLTTANRLIS